MEIKITVDEKFVNEAPPMKADSDQAVMVALKGGASAQQAAHARIAHEARKGLKSLLFEHDLFQRFRIGTEHVIGVAARKAGLVGGEGYVSEESPEQALKLAEQNMLNNAGGQLIHQGDIVLRCGGVPEDIAKEVWARAIAHWKREREQAA